MLKVLTINLDDSLLPEVEHIEFENYPNLENIDLNCCDFKVIIVHLNGFTDSDQQILSDLETTCCEKIARVVIAPALNTSEQLHCFELGVTHLLPEDTTVAVLKELVQDFQHIDQALADKDKFAQDAMQAAITAMTNTGELGQVIQFMRQSFQVNTVEDIAELLIQTLSQSSLRSAVQIRMDQAVLNESSGGAVSAMEAQLMESMTNSTAIVSHGTRTLFCYGRLTLFVKNMPIDDEELYGRQKDNLALLSEGAASRIDAILNQDTMTRKSEALNRAVSLTRRTLDDYRQSQRVRRSESKQVLEQLLSDLEDIFSNLGMTLEQEELVMNLTTTAVDRVTELFLSDGGTDRYLEFLLDQIRRSDQV